MRAILFLVPLGLLSLCGCRTQGVDPGNPPISPSVEEQASTDMQGAALPPGEEQKAIDAIRLGEYSVAHDILGRLLFAEHLASARERLASGDPEDALLATEKALRLLPRDTKARLLDARCRLAMAEKGMAEGRPFVRESLEDALAAYKRAGRTPEASFGASRAAYLLGLSDEALDHALLGMENLTGAGVDLDRLPQRTYAEAAYAAYQSKKSVDEAAKEEIVKLFQITETALTSLLGRAPADPWVHTTLAHLYEWELRYVDARDALVRGLDHVPTDRGMLDRLAIVARQAGGSEGALVTFEEFVARHPDVAVGHWYEAFERFSLALDGLDGATHNVEPFRAAESAFRRCRELSEEYAQDCKGYEVICRNAIGWCLYNSDDIEGAREAFLSMDELLERGLTWQLEDRLLSGVLGLAFCADAYNREKDWLRAAELNEFLRRYEPDEVIYANNAGFFFRDASTEVEYEGQRFCDAARGLVTSAEAIAALRAAAGIGDDVLLGTDEEQAAFREAANQRMEDARDLMQKSAAAYRAAAELAPQDVRVVNDTALVLMYYLHSDIDAAETMLLRCVDMGAEQSLDESLDEDSRFALRSAWGDANQNLGVLHYIYREDPETALTWFQKSMEIDPDGRGDVAGFWLPFLSGELEAAEDDDFLALKDWAEPCD